MGECRVCALGKVEGMSGEDGRCTWGTAGGVPVEGWNVPYRYLYKKHITIIWIN